MHFVRLVAIIFGVLSFFSINAIANEENSKYELNSKEGCLEENIIPSKEASLIDLIKIGICNNPSLNSDYMIIGKGQQL